MKTTPTPSTNLHLIYFANCGKYSELIDGSEKSGFLMKFFLYAVENKEETNHIQLFCLKTILLGLFYSGRPKKLGRVLTGRCCHMLKNVVILLWASRGRQIADPSCDLRGLRLDSVGTIRTSTRRSSLRCRS